MCELLNGGESRLVVVFFDLRNAGEALAFAYTVGDYCNHGVQAVYWH